MAIPLTTFDFDQVLAGGFRMPTRMTAIPLASGGVALVSPVPMDDALAARVEALGPVEFLVAPNLLHHLYLADAAGRFPKARVLGPAGLRTKRPDLRIDLALGGPLPDELTTTVEVVPIEGAPSVDEFVFYHRPSQSLVVTDLVFNVTRPRGVIAHVALWLMGCHGRVAQSRAWKFFVKDRAAAARSARRVLGLAVRTLVVAHGDVVTEDVPNALARALEGMASREPSRLAASSSGG